MHHCPSRLIVALDFKDKNEMSNLISCLDPAWCKLKVGHALFTHYGPSLVEELMQKGFSIFLDLKFHDIPNTVAEACYFAGSLGVWMVNVHIQGGQRMLEAAANALRHFKNPPLLVGVTVLTSLEQQDLENNGISLSLSELVLRMAQNAKKAGLDGVVCSAKEAAVLKKEIGRNFIIVSPGIRFQDTQHDDQKRVMTPEAALMSGVDYLVMGRDLIHHPQKIPSLIQLMNEHQI